ncbi:MAG: hypothetical protein Q7V20_21630 [Aquabacterium sp.]|uniref:hypothetical protein n=1 Tax=Aquabacterium sp. TaxID=1872578 RepID=UPI002718EF7D|nr:hypothetical protein [Aquabacterium sp.]MDO9006053.1 hypothetical protein [Aquabacterium sp.]
MIVFFNTKFTDFQHPELLSIGLVNADGEECYAELDLGSPAGQEAWSRSSEFVCTGGVLHQWDIVSGCSENSDGEMGAKVGRWIQALHQASQEPVEIAYGSDTDVMLLKSALRSAGVVEALEKIATFVDISSEISSSEADAAMEAFFASLSILGIRRHHALADAAALMTGYATVRGTPTIRTFEF